MAKTKIEWADRVWNPVRGCSRVSKGCENCYAERLANRFSGVGQPFEGLVRFSTSGPKWTGNIMMLPEKLMEPLRWTKPSRVFVNSMSDLFHEKVTDDFIGQVFRIMAQAEKHTFMILTKRADLMYQWFQTQASVDAMEVAFARGLDWPLPNVWLGVSAEDQKSADERIPYLLGTPAQVRFVSAEPLIDMVSLASIPCPSLMRKQVDADSCAVCLEDGRPACNNGYLNAMNHGLDWVIGGCESGPSARPMEERWVRVLRDECKEHDISFFYKQAKDERGRKEGTPKLDGRRYVEFPDGRGGTAAQESE